MRDHFAAVQHTDMRTHRSNVLAALACALVLFAPACGDDGPPKGPEPVRVAIEPDFNRLGNADPQLGLPPWRRTSSYVLSDDREGHSLRPGVDLVLPLPAGELACETSIAAQTQLNESRNTPIAIDFWLEEDGARRLLVQKRFDLVALREHWLTIDLEFGHPIVRGAHLIARVSDVGAQAFPPGTQLFLGDPNRSGGGDTRTNLLVISVDTLRADHLHCYGYARDTSPSLDALASRGVLFEQAQSSAPWTMASYGSLFTSRSPSVHRSGVNPKRASSFPAGSPDENALDVPEALAPDLPVLAEILRDHGYATAGFHNNPYLLGATGLRRGFQRWVYYHWCADTAVDLALDWIGRRRGAPWFAFVHVVDPHQPYSPPTPFDRKYAGTAPEDVPGYPLQVDQMRKQVQTPATRQFYMDEYDGEIAWTDAQIGRLLETLAASGELDHTLVIFHADHGEELWDHDGYEHGHTEYQELLHVPLILSMPGRIPKNERVPTRVGLIDVLPTVLEILQVDVPPAIEGRSLLPMMKGGKVPEREFFSECLLYGAVEAKALIVGNEKVIVIAGKDPMLFDLALDPHELHDLAPTNKARADKLREKLLRRARTVAAQAHTSTTRVFSEAENDDLNTLGYTRGKGARAGAPDKPKPSGQPEPGDKSNPDDKH